jgi:hypothetical protein
MEFTVGLRHVDDKAGGRGASLDDPVLVDCADDASLDEEVAISRPESTVGLSIGTILSDARHPSVRPAGLAEAAATALDFTQHGPPSGTSAHHVDDSSGIS